MPYLLYSASRVCLAFILLSTVKGKDAETCFTPVVCTADKYSQTSWKQVYPAVGCENSNPASLDSLRKDFEEKFEKITKTIDDLSKKVANTGDESKRLNHTIIQVGDEARKNFLYIPKENYCYMGMKDYSIPSSAITASSEVDYNHAAYLARLDSTFSMTSKTSFKNGAWTPASNSVEWIQVDFGIPKFVGGVVTQGRSIPPTGHTQWVESFIVSYGNNTFGNNMTTFKSSGIDQIFQANYDTDGKVVNMFQQPIMSRYIRLTPKTWNVRVSMRMEFIRGQCYALYPPVRSKLP